MSELRKKLFKKETIPGLIFVLIPILSVCLQSLFSGYNCFTAAPTWSDELGYWRIMYSFDNVGFKFGQTECFLNGLPEIGHLGSHGLKPFLAWGWYALLFKWKENSIVIADIIMLTVANLILVCLAKPTNKQLAMMSVATLCFIPFQYYLCSSMMEMPCYIALIISYAVGEAYERTREKKYLVLDILLFVYVVGIRCIYAPIFLPIIFMASGYKIDKKGILKFIPYVICFGVLYIFYGKFMTPYSEGFSANFSNASTISGKWAALSANIKTNFCNYFSIVSDTPVQVVQRYIYLEIIVLLLLGWFFKRKEEIGRKLGFWAIGVISVWAGTVALYDVFDFRDFRTLAPMGYIGLMALIQNMDWSDSVKAWVRVRIPIVVSAVACCIFFPLMACNREGRYEIEDFSESWPVKDINSGAKEGAVIAFEEFPGEIGFFEAIDPLFGMASIWNENAVIEQQPDYAVLKADIVIENYEKIGSFDDYLFVYRRTY